MESFFLSETTKYLFLMHSRAVHLPDFYVFSTEGHLLPPFPAAPQPPALRCLSLNIKSQYLIILNEFSLIKFSQPPALRCHIYIYIYNIRFKYILVNVYTRYQS